MAMEVPIPLPSKMNLLSQTFQAGTMFHAGWRKLKLDSRESERAKWQRAGMSQPVIATALACKRASTRAVSDTRWAAFAKWCTEEHFDPLALPVTQILDYLQGLVAQNKAINTIKGYITAISDRHDKVKLRSKYLSISQLPSIQIWIRGLTLSKHIPRVMIPSWDLDIVLSALKKHPYYPLETASLKHLTLRTAFLIAVTSARRASEIHALQADNLQFHSTGVSAFLHPKFIPKVGQQWHINRPIELPAMHTENDPELRKLCVRSDSRIRELHTG